MKMTDKQNMENNGKGIDIFSEAMAALLYSDEEIRATLSPEEAEEFIELRNSLFPDEQSNGIVLGGYGDDDACMQQAAEEETPYE
jgi:hypothetical protein